MKIYKLTAILLLISALIGCSGNDEFKTAFIEGSFSVADSIDSSRDFSGIGLTIVKRDSSNADADTLFHQVTDSTGKFRGEARFKDRRQYSALISRNERNLARFGLILADRDTIKIRGELPNLENSIEVESREHNAMEVFQRINRGFQRVAAFAQAGRLTGDSLNTELNKWSNLYWEVYQNHEGTLASQMAASESVRLLQGWNDEAMMSKIRSVQDKDELVSLGATYGKSYLAGEKGLDYTLQYLDTLQNNSNSQDSEMRVTMERIKLLYDSARVEQAKQLLLQFEQSYPENRNAQSWAEAISYDLNYLSPGDTIPSFSFEVNGNTFSRDSLMGTPYILEITTLANRLYQDQYDRTVAIHSLYKNFGLQVITIPLDNSQVTVDAFFEARGIKPWPVAPAQAFERQELLELFNVRVIPTRFLIDRQGRIIRKYVGREYTDVIQGIQTIIKQDNSPS
ncbi:TlpA family protein disulfide reductase [Balneolaceae bacterium YR4-1]|uniref:TlpA family protein disulfide reductase n=1 Tax=Halalkalibaculum roseum TaxID=2709311 RepID=A0A6M1SV37_9BACT|nr:TlpA disulfide reductase family protein [Halalkalibaculum roseum]NGP76820.1 TlpA family protein disulfide reductase [Halalkalibaculum roseum]